jgi:TRAP-type C4-dicarboxylate transport system permease small subunit
MSLGALLTRADWALEKLIRVYALLGGAVLVAMALGTVVSITGRALIRIGLGPIPGDFELIEMGTAIAVFSFLPICHLGRGHVTVDIMTDVMPCWLANIFTILGKALVLVMAAVMARQLWFGMMDKMRYGETTMLLGVPVWYGYLFSVIGAGLFLLAAVVVLGRDVVKIVHGKRL